MSYKGAVGGYGSGCFGCAGLGACCRWSNGTRHSEDNDIDDIANDDVNMLHHYDTA